MEVRTDCMNVGLVLLSSDYRVMGINDFAKKLMGPAAGKLGKNVLDLHPKKSHGKIMRLLDKLRSRRSDIPEAKVIDALGKVLMINLSRVETWEHSPGSFFALAFMDITEQTGAEVNAGSGMVELKKLPVYDRGVCMFIETSAIYFVRSEGNFCNVVTPDGSYCLNLSLKCILREHMGRNFFRVHRSYIANLNHVLRIERSPAGKITAAFDVEDIPPVPVSRRRYQEFKTALASK